MRSFRYLRIYPLLQSHRRNSILSGPHRFPVTSKSSWNALHQLEHLPRSRLDVVKRRGTQPALCGRRDNTLVNLKFSETPAERIALRSYARKLFVPFQLRRLEAAIEHLVKFTRLDPLLIFEPLLFFRE